MEQAPLSMLSPSTTTTIYSEAPVVPAVVPEVRPSNVLGVVALILAVIAVIIVLIMAISWLVSWSRGTSGETWNVVLGKSNGSNSGSESFTPTGSSVLLINALSSNLTVNIESPKNNLTGKIFMIDNTGNSQHINVQSNTNTIIDNIGEGRICTKATATYMWTSNSVIRRLY